MSAPVSWLSQGERDLPPGDDWLAKSERERASTLRFTKRRDDYLLARFTAKQAIARVLGLPLDPGSLRRIEVRSR